MMGTPCFLLESVPINIGNWIPHKIQDLGAPGSGGMEGENTTCVSDENQWQNVPNLNFNRSVRKIKLNCNWYDNCNSNWAAASLVRDSPLNPLSIKAGDFSFKRSQPAAKHATDFLEL